jgi:hypothetical protein
MCDAGDVAVLGDRAAAERAHHHPDQVTDAPAQHLREQHVSGSVRGFTTIWVTRCSGCLNRST